MSLVQSDDDPYVSAVQDIDDVKQIVTRTSLWMLSLTYFGNLVPVMARLAPIACAVVLFAMGPFAWREPSYT